MAFFVLPESSADCLADIGGRRTNETVLFIVAISSIIKSDWQNNVNI